MILRNITQHVKDQSAFLQVLRHASSFTSGPHEPVTLVELLSSGGLSELSSPGPQIGIDQQITRGEVVLAEIEKARK